MVLENKLGITDSLELAKQEEKISKAKALEIFDNKIIDNLEVGKFSSLKEIHYHLFSEIYFFAGQIRKVNISKGNFRFAPLIYLDDALRRIDEMPQGNFDEIIEKYVEMNIAHPFREGNGRSIRLWFNILLKKELNKVIDWSIINKEDYLLVMERSPVRDIEIKHLFKKSLTDKVHDKSIYMIGIDASYNYEGYNSYITKNIYNFKF